MTQAVKIHARRHELFQGHFQGHNVYSCNTMCGTWTYERMTVWDPAWRCLPRQAQCGRCRELWSCGCASQEHILSVEVALIGIAREFAAWPDTAPRPRKLTNAELRAKHTCMMNMSSMNCSACNAGVPYPHRSVDEMLADMGRRP